HKIQYSFAVKPSFVTFYSGFHGVVHGSFNNPASCTVIEPPPGSTRISGELNRRATVIHPVFVAFSGRLVYCFGNTEKFKSHRYTLPSASGLLL
ncbi:hypothetical protein, partial [Escherichia coli]